MGDIIELIIEFVFDVVGEFARKYQKSFFLLLVLLAICGYYLYKYFSA